MSYYAQPLMARFLEAHTFTKQDDCDLCNAFEKSSLVYAQIYREFRRVMQAWFVGDANWDAQLFIGNTNVLTDWVALESIIEDMSGTNLCNEWEAFKEKIAEQEERDALEDAESDAAFYRHVERGEQFARDLENAA